MEYDAGALYIHTDCINHLQQHQLRVASWAQCTERACNRPHTSTKTNKLDTWNYTCSCVQDLLQHMSYSSNALWLCAITPPALSQRHA